MIAHADLAAARAHDAQKSSRELAAADALVEQAETLLVAAKANRHAIRMRDATRVALADAATEPMTEPMTPDLTTLRETSGSATAHDHEGD